MLVERHFPVNAAMLGNSWRLSELILSMQFERISGNAPQEWNAILVPKFL
jgi:hypothetical protein